MLLTGLYGPLLDDPEDRVLNEPIAKEYARWLRGTFPVEFSTLRNAYKALVTGCGTLKTACPPDSRGGLREGFETATELFAVMGAVISPKAKPLDNPQTARINWNTAAHIMGTTVVGDDPQDSVVDRWGRTHDIPNLWIVGSSVFPTSATANPTLTIAALTLRPAQAIHRALQ